MRAYLTFHVRCQDGSRGPILPGSLGWAGDSHGRISLIKSDEITFCILPRKSTPTSTIQARPEVEEKSKYLQRKLSE